MVESTNPVPVSPAARRSHFSARMHQPAVPNRSKNRRKRNFLPHHACAQIALLVSYGLPRAQHHFLKCAAIFPQRHFVRCTAVHVVEHRSRQPPLRQPPQILDIDHMR